MKQFILFLLVIAIFIASCTPDLDNDIIAINFSNNTIYDSYYSPDTTAALVKINYNGEIEKNNIIVNDTTYLKNALFFKDEDQSTWHLLHLFGADSNIYVIKKNANQIYVNYMDSVYIFKYANPDTILTDSFDINIYPDSATITSIGSLGKVAIDSLNNYYEFYDSYLVWKNKIRQQYE